MPVYIPKPKLEYAIAAWIIFVVLGLLVGLLGVGMGLGVAVLAAGVINDWDNHREDITLDEHEQAHAYALWWEQETGDPTLRRFHEESCAKGALLSCEWQPYKRSTQMGAHISQPLPLERMKVRLELEQDYGLEDHIMAEVARAYEHEKTKAPVKHARKALAAPDPQDKLMNSISFRALLYEKREESETQ